MLDTLNSFHDNFLKKGATEIVDDQNQGTGVYTNYDIMRMSDVSGAVEQYLKDNEFLNKYHKHDVPIEQYLRDNPHKHAINIRTYLENNPHKHSVDITKYLKDNPHKHDVDIMKYLINNPHKHNIDIVQFLKNNPHKHNVDIVQFLKNNPHKHDIDFKDIENILIDKNYQTIDQVNDLYGIKFNEFKKKHEFSHDASSNLLHSTIYGEMSKYKTLADATNDINELHNRINSLESTLNISSNNNNYNNYNIIPYNPSDSSNLAKAGDPTYGQFTVTNNVDENHIDQAYDLDYAKNYFENILNK